MAKNKEDPSDYLFLEYTKRAQKLKGTGLHFIQAHGIASLELRIKQWPKDWGEYLQVLIYGDFQPLEAPLEISSLGIVIHPEKLENTVIRSALCVHKAIVTINEKSVSALIDAAQRINVFLGARTLVGWGNGTCSWWSFVTHGTASGAMTVLDHKDLPMAIDGIQSLPPELRLKLDSALYWVREPKNSIFEFYRNDILRIYSAYWNAFECLVEAVNIIKPRNKRSKKEKQQLIYRLVENNSGKLTPKIIEECYKEVVNPGFVAKASHALTICFEEKAESYINECFRLAEKNNRLYEIRNAINHGNIDAENPNELIRVESRINELWMIVWRMFGKLIPFPAPKG